MNGSECQTAGRYVGQLVQGGQNEMHVRDGEREVFRPGLAAAEEGVTIGRLPEEGDDTGDLTLPPGTMETCQALSA